MQHEYNNSECNKKKGLKKNSCTQVIFASYGKIKNRPAKRSLNKLKKLNGEKKAQVIASLFNKFGDKPIEKRRVECTILETGDFKFVEALLILEVVVDGIYSY
jgi:hypothetical protein